jgi:hypothetical protein
MPRNVYPNIVMGALQDLIETSLYKYLNVSIHHQWVSLFTLHINSESQIPIYNNASSDNFNSNNEKIHCTPTNSMIHNCLNVLKIWIMKIVYILLPQVKIFTLLVYLKINIQKN